MGSFKELALKKEIIESLSRNFFIKTTEVQEKIIPLALQKKNLVFTAMTGSGKTLAYSVGFLSKINPKLGIQMLVLVPTRELCLQVSKELKKIATPLGINVGFFHGGHDMVYDKKTLQTKNQIIVATPGRLIVYVNETKVKLGDVNLIVYDESDQMFDNGFSDDCAYLKTRICKTAQIILCSATISVKVSEFIKKEIKDYEFLEIGKQIPQLIVQEKVKCKIPDKGDFLLKFLEKNKFSKVLIFCNKKDRTNTISDFLNKNQIKSLPMNSDLEQKDREMNLKLLKLGKVVLVATDVAARGLHIEDVDCVINYDVPTKAEFYLHRIGRSGRKNKKGYALTMICPEDKERFEDIEFDYNLKVKLIS